MKDRPVKDILYAFADYKQLVLAYKTKYAELIKTVTFWKTSLLWLGVLSTGIILLIVFLVSQANTDLAQSKKDLNALNDTLEVISTRLNKAQEELAIAQQELENKEAVIKELEKSMSTNSKKLLEKLLKDQEAEKAAE